MNRTEWVAELAVPASEDREHIQGRLDAAVTLVQYGDYECPYSGKAYPIVKEVQARMGERPEFVFSAVGSNSDFLVPPAGIEPATHGLGNGVRLNYAHTLRCSSRLA